MLSFTEENYLKALVQQTVFIENNREIGVNKLAIELNVKPATVSDMVKKLSAKGYVNFQKYGKISLTDEGVKKGMLVVRRHRLWETFLHDKLDFSWDEVHEIAEELEHVHSKKLINGLDKLLGYPDFDPHGDAIPNEKGEILIPFRKTLNEVEVGDTCKVVAVKDDASSFLKYVNRIGLKIEDVIEVIGREEFDASLTIRFSSKEIVVSREFSENIFVVCSICLQAKGCKCQKIDT